MRKHLIKYYWYSSSIGTATCSTIVEYTQQEDFYRMPLPAARQTPQPGGPVIRTFQLPPPGVPHVWKDASEPQQQKVELWARNFREFCRNWRLPRHFRVLLHAINVRHGTDDLLLLRRKASWGFFRPKNPTASAGFEPANSGTRGQHAYL